MEKNTNYYSKIVSFKKKIFKRRIIPPGISFLIDNFFNNFHNFIFITRDITRDFVINSRKRRKILNSIFVYIYPFIFLSKSLYELLYVTLTFKSVTIKNDLEAIKEIDFIIVNSNNVRDRVRKFYNRDSAVIYPPIPVNKFYSSSKEKSLKSYWISVNRLTPEKRIEIQIEAFNNLDDNLIIVGGYEDSFYSEKLRKLANSNISFIKDVNEDTLRDMYAGSKGFITTAHDEDFGMTAVEAMASGKPVIAPNEGGYRESIINNKTGILIDNINAIKLSDAVKKINKELEHDKDAYKYECQLQAKKFDTSIFIKNIDKEINLLIEQKKDFKKEKTALAIFSFDRPKYLKKVLNSLEKNSDLKNLDFYLFQDGMINKFSGRVTCLEKDIEKCIYLWNKCSLPNKHLIQNHFNLGIAINQFEAKVRLFEDYEYEQVIFFEDDMLLSKNYIRLLHIMLDQFKYDKDVAVVMCNGGKIKIRTEDENIKFIYKLRTGNDNLWGWAMWKDRWELIKPAFLKYYKFVENIDYKDRDENKIKDFFKKEGFLVNESSQDAAMKYAFNYNNLIELNTFIHRGKYIGKCGVHMTPSLFRDFLYSKIKKYDFIEDYFLEKFDDYDKKRFKQYTKKIFGN